MLAFAADEPDAMSAALTKSMRADEEMTGGDGSGEATLAEAGCGTGGGTAMPCDSSSASRVAMRR